MNDKIKQLANQAGIQLPDSSVYNGHIYQNSIERFAKLLVKECGVALSPMLRDMISRGQAFDLIKDHFGVDMNKRDYDEQGGERGWAER